MLPGALTKTRQRRPAPASMSTAAPVTFRLRDRPEAAIESCAAERAAARAATVPYRDAPFAASYRPRCRAAFSIAMMKRASLPRPVSAIRSAMRGARRVTLFAKLRARERRAS